MYFFQNLDKVLLKNMIDIGNTVNTRQSRTGIRMAIERNISRYIRENRVDAIILNVRRGIINSDYIIGNNGDSLLHYAIRYKKCDVVSALLNILNVF